MIHGFFSNSYKLQTFKNMVKFEKKFSLGICVGVAMALNFRKIAKGHMP